MELFSFEAILCANNIKFNEKIIFYYLNMFHPTLISALSIASVSTTYMGLYIGGDLLRGFLKDGGSPTLDAQNQPIMEYTLMVAQAGQPPLWVFTLTATLRGAS